MNETPFAEAAVKIGLTDVVHGHVHSSLRKRLSCTRKTSITTLTFPKQNTFKKSPKQKIMLTITRSKGLNVNSHCSFGSARGVCAPTKTVQSHTEELVRSLAPFTAACVTWSEGWSGLKEYVACASVYSLCGYLLE